MRHPSEDRGHDIVRPTHNAQGAWTEDQRAYWRSYVRDLADRMMMQHFRLINDWDRETQNDNSADASTWVNYGEPFLRTAWHADLPRWHDYEQRDTAVHKLLHGVLRHLEAAASGSGLEALLHTDAWKIHESRVSNALEEACGWLARIIAPTMPLPEWPNTGGPIPTEVSTC